MAAGSSTIAKSVVVHMLSAFGDRISKGELELLLEQKGVTSDTLTKDQFISVMNSMA
eukprot:m.118507 g.118507  ORF g.118507 m.118507 type:complete len:57 (+) comp17209_c0_seq3:308-478(+)